MAIHVTFEYDEAEHGQAIREVQWRPSSRYVMWGVGVAALGVAAWLVMADRGRIASADQFMFTIPLVVFGVAWIAGGSLGQRRAANSAAEHDASAWGSQERIIDDAGFHSRANGLSADLPWDAMVGGKETDEFFLFYPEKRWAYYLPKRALSRTEMEEVRSLMGSRLSGRARLLGS